MKRFVAGKNEEGARLSRFVESVTHGLPPSLLYKSFRNRRVKVNGKRAAPEARLREGDVVELYINDEFFAAPAPELPRKKSPPPDIVYEDAHIAALYKPPHLLCHSDRTGDDSLVDRFCAYLQAKGEYDPAAEAAFRPALCNRLDRGTEGLVLAAKDYAALRDMNAVIRDDLVRKEYLTITCGVPPKGRHTAWLRHFEKGNRVQVRAGAAPGYKQIVTDVAVLRTAGPLALCRIGLVTGRTHQIRAHLAFLGAPVLGDGKYGSKRMNERFGLRTQALCAVRVTFGDIGPDSSLCYLAGRTLALDAPEIERQFDALAAQAKRAAGGRQHGTEED